ncbi:MAG: hypothetical protein HWN81_19665 [Candidatus Lokiarchaeota archaeon]|nr:hypothetical protein [Candidatus Lokiarchaeota archaeon]
MMSNNVNPKYPREFDFLVQDILYILDLESHSEYQQDEYDVEEKLAFHGLNSLNIQSFENLACILKFAKDLIGFYEEKYCKYPEGYFFYKDTVKKMKEYVKVLDAYHKSKKRTKK